MRQVWVVLSSVGIALQLLLIHQLAKGAFRQFRIVSVYVLTLFLTTIVEAAAFYNPLIWSRTSSYYWVVDSIRQALIFLVVISLTHSVMGSRPDRAAVRRLLILGALVFTLASLMLTRGDPFGIWMAKVGRNLGFCAVVLNLILWAFLIRYRQADRLLLMISGGLGIQMAGKAIGHSFRQLSSTTTTAGELIIVVSHLACLYIWWQAFRFFDRRTAGQYNKV